MSTVFPVYRWPVALIIDDNPTDSLVCERLIKMAYLAEVTIMVNSVSKAMAYLIKEKNKKGKLPEIIFLDLLMPVENGLSFLKYYEDSFSKKEQSETRIVLLTSAETGAELEAARKSPVIYKILTKPFSLTHLEALK